MTDTSPLILWYRRDLRLSDHPALSQAIDTGRPVIPLFIHDDVVAAQGAAARFRLGLSVASLEKDLAQIGSRLILRRGPARDVLQALVKETGAAAVYWSRLYDPVSKDRDMDIKAALKDAGLEVRSFPGHLLFEPWTVETQTGGFYKVFTPMWKAVRGRDLSAALPAPGRIKGPDSWPASDALADWAMGADMRRGGPIVAAHCRVGQASAQARLDEFMAQRVNDYRQMRDIPGVDGTSGLSENLTCGEISPRHCWHAGWRALNEGRKDAETFLKELVWREFAYHLAHHTPHILTENWKEGWDAFPWRTDADQPEVLAWKQGQTGVLFVDAAMREMYVTGRMHNRGRMIVASYLTKHLMCHWKIGRDWFADCLTDWDPASNAMGWQWSAGSGPDATPYFRVFNAETQLDKFDRDRAYVKAWIAEGHGTPSATALSYFDAIPLSWGLSADQPYPDPIVSMEDGRKRALDAYENRDF